MTQAIKCQITKEIKRDGIEVYYLIPSPELGLTAKCGNPILNEEKDPIWSEIKANAFEYPLPATHRVEVIINEDSIGSYDSVTVKSLRQIEG
jgi:hypothetical protein